MFRALAARPGLFVTGYLALALLTSATLVVVRSYDQWLFLLVWPVILSAALFPRRLYLLVLGLALLVVVGTLVLIVPDIAASLRTVLAGGVMTLIACESLFRLMRRQRTATAALRISEERFRSTFERAPVPMAITDLQGRLKRFNPALSVMLGYDASELQGIELNSIAHPEDRAVGHRLRDAIMAAGGDADLEKRYICKDGRVIHMLLKGTLLLDANGQPHELLGIFFDLTERRQAEENRLAFERTILERQRLESLGVLAAGVAHDFNNLLAGVMGNTNVALLELPPESPARACLSQIEVSVKRAADLTRHMLAYAGHGRVMRETIDMNATIGEFDALLDTLISAAITVEYRLAPGALPVYIDRAQLQQMLTALMMNAVESIGENPGTIVVVTDRRTLQADDTASHWIGAPLPAGEYALIEIRDTGCGMDEATRERIFDPFFSTKQPGRGLGLAATLGIVRSHGGALQVESAPGAGSVFRIVLPVCGAAITGNVFPPEKTPAPRAAVPDRERRILVVDDEAAVRTVTSRMLERLGYQTLVAPDGQAAVDLFAAHADTIACVLLDVTMPVMGGAQALQAIREVRPEAPVVLMSGYASEETAARFAQLRPTGFLHKPFDTSELRTCLEAAFRHAND
ncbi:MAG: response regulator [Chloroflexi bacterium]|nr:response regulator [Chloroflexota bacterium]